MFGHVFKPNYLIESVEEGGESSLWRRVVQQYPSLADVSFSQFASLDQHVTTENQMTENDVEREALEEVPNQSRMLALKGTSQTLMMIYQ